MQKRTCFTLSLGVVCALLLAACASTTNDNAANANATRATNTAVVTNNNAAVPAATAPTSTANSSSSGDKIGVPECDDYLAKYEACIAGKVPEAARAQYETTLAQTRRSWRDLAANPQTKASLAQACKTATESARQTMKSIGCEF